MYFILPYVLLCVLLYLFQEKLLFFPQKLEKGYAFRFNQPFTEITISTADNTSLHGLLFPSPQSKKLLFYLHGNAGSVATWGEAAETYTALGYDVFMMDYRGYGKSGGVISNKQQLLSDVQTVYNHLKKTYAEDSIVVLGYSLGTGLAAHLASENHPRLLILQAPYYSLTDMMRRRFPIIPTFILKYRLNTFQYLQNCKMPVVLFHGDKDEVIYYGSSVKLKAWLKPTDTLITLSGQRHMGMTENKEYQLAIKEVLK